MFERRINIFTGHFGSGKTEVAVNYSIKMAGLSGKTVIVDFDIVNPYFRTADARTELEAHGIRVIAPVYANSNVDVPALPPEIYMLFEDREYKVVLDVGGDDIGAKAVSRFRDEILQDDYELFFVINPRRPMTDTPARIKEMIREIEGSARIKVTSLVNNTNLLGATSPEDILEGHRLISQVAKELDLPVGFASGLRPVVSGLDKMLGTDVLEMQKLIRLPWDR